MPVYLERRAERARRDHGRHLPPVADRLPDDRLPPLHARLEAPAARTPRRASQPTDRDPRPAAPRARGRSDRRPLQEPRHALRAAALDALPRRRTTGRPPTAPTCPGFSGRDGDVKPGQTWTYRLRAGRDSAGVWPYHDHSPSMEQSIAGGLYGDAVDPRAPRARARPRVRRLLRGHARLQDDRRPRVRRQHARDEGRASATSSSGTCSRSGPSTTPSTSTAIAGSSTAPARHEDARPGRELPDPLARGRAGNVALPLPRRAAHDARDDRHLPGLVPAMMRPAIVLAALRCCWPRAPARADTSSVQIVDTAYNPPRVAVLTGDTVGWRNSSFINQHTVTSADLRLRPDRPRRRASSTTSRRPGPTCTRARSIRS